MTDIVWTHHSGGTEWWTTPGWFVQQLANGLWITGPLPASPHSWAAAELLYVSREDAMRGVEQRQHKAAAWLAQDSASRTCSDALAEAHDREPEPALTPPEDRSGVHRSVQQPARARRGI